MRVDGFRFDLMSALTRVGYEVDMGCHLLTAIGQDPTLRHVKLIAEPWDVSTDGYRVGEFPPPWVEWNDQFRDTVRDFWRGRSGGHPDRGDPARRLVGPVRRRRALAVRLGELRDRARRLHAARRGLLRAQAQPRPTARATATAATTTGRRTSGSRARPTTRRSSRCGGGSRPT